MLKRFKQWRRAKVRALEFGNNYIRFTPNFGFGLVLLGGNRVRFAFHHGLQLVRLRGERWVVVRQLAGRSRVKGEAYLRRPALTSPTTGA